MGGTGCIGVRGMSGVQRQDKTTPSSYGSGTGHTEVRTGGTGEGYRSVRRWGVVVPTHPCRGGSWVGWALG